jgi:hypothetical protein
MSPPSPTDAIRRAPGPAPDDDTPLAAAVAVPVALVVLGMMFAASLVVSGDERRSERENRTLAAWPTASFAALRDGSYTRAIDAWVADHFPLRERFLDVAAACKDARGFAVDNAVFDAAPLGDFGLDPVDAVDGVDAVEAVEAVVAVVDAGSTVGVHHGADDDDGDDGDDAGDNGDGVGAGEAPPAGVASVDAGAPTNAARTDEQGGAHDGGVTDAGTTTPRRRYESGIAIVDDRALMYLVGDDGTARAFAEAVNAWADALPNDVRLDLLVTPTATHYYLPAAQADRSLPQRENLAVLRAALRPSVRWVDVEAALAAHVDEPIFFRTDHHWTGLGAYYAYAAWASQAGFAPVALEQLEKRTRPASLGSLHRATQSRVLARHPEPADYWVPSVAYSAQRWRSLDEPPQPVKFLFERERGYTVFLGGDDPLLVAAVDNRTGRRALLVKNSYGNAIAPLLLHHFDEVVVVDYRYYGKRALDLVQKHRITDVVIVNATVTTNSRPHARRMKEALGGRGTAWEPVRGDASAGAGPTTATTAATTATTTGPTSTGPTAATTPTTRSTATTTTVEPPASPPSTPSAPLSTQGAPPAPTTPGASVLPQKDHP